MTTQNEKQSSRKSAGDSIPASVNAARDCRVHGISESQLNNLTLEERARLGILVSARGVEEEIADAKTEGFDDGREDGYDDGYAQGQADAEREGQKAINKLREELKQKLELLIAFVAE